MWERKRWERERDVREKEIAREKEMWIDKERDSGRYVYRERKKGRESKK